MNSMGQKTPGTPILPEVSSIFFGCGHILKNSPPWSIAVTRLVFLPVDIFTHRHQTCCPLSIITLISCPSPCCNKAVVIPCNHWLQPRVCLRDLPQHYLQHFSIILLKIRTIDSPQPPKTQSKRGLHQHRHASVFPSKINASEHAKMSSFLKNYKLSIPEDACMNGTVTKFPSKDKNNYKIECDLSLFLD